jgi:transcriptional regulator with XRE-family HTH domain
MPAAGAQRRVHNRLPALLDDLGVPLGELSRRTLLPAHVLTRLRSRHANPSLRIAERVARALEVHVEAIFSLSGRRHAAPASFSRVGLGPLLAERRLSDVRFAHDAGLDRAHVNRLKNGRTLPSVGTALAVAAALGVDVATAFPPRPIRRGRARSILRG